MSNTKGSKNNIANRGQKQPHVCVQKVYGGTGRPHLVRGAAAAAEAACKWLGAHRGN